MAGPVGPHRVFNLSAVRSGAGGGRAHTIRYDTILYYYYRYRYRAVWAPAKRKSCTSRVARRKVVKMPAIPRPNINATDRTPCPFITPFYYSFGVIFPADERSIFFFFLFHFSTPPRLPRGARATRTPPPHDALLLRAACKNPPRTRRGRTTRDVHYGSQTITIFRVLYVHVHAYVFFFFFRGNHASPQDERLARKGSWRV